MNVTDLLQQAATLSGTIPEWSPPTFGNEGAIPAEGRLFAGRGVRAKEGFWFIREEASCAVHWWQGCAHAAGPANAPAGAASTNDAHAAWRLQQFVKRTEALANIHCGCQLVDIKLQREKCKEQEKKKKKWKLIQSGHDEQWT